MKKHNSNYWKLVAENYAEEISWCHGNKRLAKKVSENVRSYMGNKDVDRVQKMVRRQNRKNKYAEQAYFDWAYATEE